MFEPFLFPVLLAGGEPGPSPEAAAAAENERTQYVMCDVPPFFT
jgi:hypothetical protein